MTAGAPQPRTTLPRRGVLRLGALATITIAAGPRPSLATTAAAGQPANEAAPSALPPPEVREALGTARLQGQGRLRYLGLHVYDIRLWVPPEFQADAVASTRLALEIEYARSLDGARIAERSLAEMRRVGEVPQDRAAPWLTAMREAFPDVHAGDRITGVQEPGLGARFYVNAARRAEIPDADFTRLFFGIWLSPRTSEPALRASLLGTGARS